jgi:flagellar hook assembly protein FlgD
MILKTTNGGAITNIQTINNKIPEGFSLSQNYPNPFNPVTMIKYQLPNANHVSIKIYDMLGRETLTLFEGNQQAGYYQATVDGTNLASGIYFCRITAEGFAKTIKMSLIK